MSTKAQQPKQASSRKKSIKQIHEELGFKDAETAFSDRRNDLELDPAIKKELEDKDLVGRFIDFREFKKKGFHRSHWKPYRPDSEPSNDVLFNKDADGFVTFQDLVLAVRPKSWNEKHKEALKKRNALQSKPVQKAREEIQQSASSAGLDSIVKEYMDDEDS